MNERITYLIAGIAIGVTSTVIFNKVIDKKDDFEIKAREKVNKDLVNRTAPKNEDILQVTVGNRRLTPSDGATARRIMDHYISEAMNADNDSDLKKAIDTLWDIYWVLENPKGNKRYMKSVIMYHRNKIGDSDINNVVGNAINGIDIKNILFKR